VDGSVISFLPLAKDDADSLGPVYWYYCIKPICRPFLLRSLNILFYKLLIAFGNVFAL
jgi:hypothetical protein